MKLPSILTGLLGLAVTNAAPTIFPQPQQQNPPKLPFTPYFHLQVAHSANKSIEGQWIAIGDGYDSLLRLNPNKSAATTFYVSNYQDQKPAPGPVLVNNATNFQDRSSKWIAGTSTCDTCGLPFSASGFQRSVQDWKTEGGFLYDFRLGDPFRRNVFFNLTDEGTLSQTLTQVCYADFASMYRFVVLSEYLKECTPIQLKWQFAGF